MHIDTCRDDYLTKTRKKSQALNLTETECQWHELCNTIYLFLDHVNGR